MSFLAADGGEIDSWEGSYYTGVGYMGLPSKLNRCRGSLTAEKRFDATLCPTRAALRAVGMKYCHRFAFAVRELRYGLVPYSGVPRPSVEQHMLRVSASILLVAHLTTLAGPGNLGLLAGGNVMLCQQLTAQVVGAAPLSGGGHLEEEADCHGCCAPECCAVVGSCMGPTVALPSDAVVLFAPTSARPSVAKSTASPDGSPKAPTLPPPRA
jgi:hypothetical protein